MTPREWERLCAAPELVVVRLLDAALVALRHALLAEHPLLDAAPSGDDPLVRQRARRALRHATRLRRALRAYRREVDDALEAPDEPLPF
jgi:hypothetical protein